MASLKNKNILVTGAAGFIGSHLCDELLRHPIRRLVGLDNLFLGKKFNLIEAEKNEKFIFAKIDVTELNGLKKIIEKYNIDVIFHLAVIPLEASLVKPDWTFRKNIQMTQSILEVIRNNKKKISLIAFSSSEVYGSAEYVPMDENHTLSPHTPYAASKAASDLLIYSYYKTFNIDMTIIRPFNNYGQRQNKGSYAGVIPLTIKRILSGKSPVINGDGSQTRDFLHVKDTVFWTLKLFENEKSRGQIINVASGKQLSVKSIIQTICNELNYKGVIRYGMTRPGDVKIHQGAIKKVKALVGFEPGVNFTEGIQSTIDWYKLNSKILQVL